MNEAIPYKDCRHRRTTSGHFYKGNCEACVIERWEACAELNRIYEMRLKKAKTALNKWKKETSLLRKRKERSDYDI